MVSTIQSKIQTVIDSSDLDKTECFLGTHYYGDLIQSDQDMLLGWKDNGGELTKVIDGIKFTINILFE